jgi:hypothetical protein
LFSHGWQAKIAIAGIAYNNSRYLYLHLIRQFGADKTIQKRQKTNFKPHNMGLKDFLKQQGFIADGPEDKKAAADNTRTARPSVVEPVYFPVNAGGTTAAAPVDPSFVTALPTAVPATAAQLDPSFIKYFEDELLKANLPGPDYFEFRQQLVKTQQKMAAKGVAAPEVVLQAVLMSFEAQDIPSAKLVEAAQHYKNVLKQKNDDFLKGAAAEKNNQLQKRKTVLQGHEDSVKKIQQQLQQLELQRKQLEQALNNEKTQMDVNKTMGQEGIEKIEKASRLITLAHDYMQATIDTDIKRLQTV